MSRVMIASLSLAACCAAAHAEPIKLPVDSDDKGSVYIAPNVSSTETSANTKGAIVGIQRKDGAETYGGVDTSTPRPTYSLGGATGGNTSFSAGAQSDGKANVGVKAGVTIKY